MSDEENRALADALIRAALCKALKDHDAREGDYLLSDDVRALLHMPASPTLH